MTFEEFWQTTYAGKMGTVGALENAFKEVAQATWTAAHTVGQNEEAADAYYSATGRRP